MACDAEVALGRARALELRAHDAHRLHRHLQSRCQLRQERLLPDAHHPTRISTSLHKAKSAEKAFSCKYFSALSRTCSSACKVTT